MRQFFKLFCFCLIFVFGGQAFDCHASEKVSVVAFVADRSLAAYERIAQARAEEILAEAGFEVLDEKKAQAMKKGWVDLADPSHIVTAEEFVARAGKYDIQRVFRIGLNANVKSVYGAFFTATAAADVRIISREARVDSKTAVEMGTRGSPPSDGLTEGAALANAIQRAVDSAMISAGIRVELPILPKSVPFKLEAVDGLPASLQERYPVQTDPGNSSWPSAAQLITGVSTGEELACRAISPDGHVGVVGGYTWSIRRIGGFSRSFGGRVHLIDIESHTEFNVFTLHELGQRGDGEDGTSAPLACQFFGNWRYLLVASGNKLVCIDVERGVNTCDFPILGGPKVVSISTVSSDQGAFVVLNTDGKKNFFRVKSK